MGCLAAILDSEDNGPHCGRRTTDYTSSGCNNTAVLIQPGFPDGSVGKCSTCNAGDPGSIPGSGRTPGEGIGYLLQSSWASLVAQLVKKTRLRCGRPGFDLWVGKIPWRRERLPTPVFWPGEFHGLYGVAKSWTRLSDFHFHFTSLH